ncbi:MAG TPA: aspartyl protease family protein [Candidatus Krumholzibacteria bacterium]|nr:aspartyl protease family protein [Candidatus Krumholzibacteria bacterium]
MRLNTLFFSVIAPALLLSTPSSALDTSCPPDRLDARGSSHHMDIISNKPWVYVTFNGSRPLHFILDAGSPFTLLNTGLPETVGFSNAGDTTFANGFTVKRYTPRACVRTLGATISNIEIGDIELDHVSAMEGERLDGLIGGQFFLKHVVRINYMESTIDVFPASYVYHGDGAVLPLNVDGLGFTDASVMAPDGHYIKGTFIVDTGVRMGLLLNAPFVDNNGLLAAEKRVPKASVGVGVNGETRGDIFRVRDVEIGGFHLPDVVAVCSRDEVVIDSNSGLAGIIGGDLLRRFRVTEDYPHSQLVLEETPETYQPFVYDRSGLFLLGEGEDYRTIRVHRVIAGSPAEDAGIRENDRIVSVDGRAARRLGLESMRALFREDNTRYRLVLEREGGLVNAQLMTKDLLKTRAAVVEGATKGS